MWWLRHLGVWLVTIISMSYQGCLYCHRVEPWETSIECDWGNSIISCITRNKHTIYIWRNISQKSISNNLRASKWSRRMRSRCTFVSLLVLSVTFSRHNKNCITRHLHPDLFAVHTFFQTLTSYLLLWRRQWDGSGTLDRRPRGSMKTFWRHGMKPEAQCYTANC